MDPNLPTVVFVALSGAWFGAGLFHVLVLGPALRRAGAGGLGFARALGQRGGTGWLFAVAAFLTVLAGVWMVLTQDAYRLPFTLNGAAIALAALFALLALILGAAVNRVAEQRMMRIVKDVEGTPTAAQGAELGAWGARARRANALAVSLVGLALGCALLGTILG